MGIYALDFEKGTNIWNLYQALKKEGVKASDLDQGYYYTDYEKRESFVIHEHDKIIQKEEVLNYALENYQKFQLAIKKNMGYPLPWSLDDLDPKTTFDQETRNKVKKAIKYFKKELKKAGYKPEEDRYQELLADFLYIFVLAPNTYNLPDEINELEDKWFIKTFKYIDKNGGLGRLEVEKPCEPYDVVISSIKNNCGKCIDDSFVLYVVLKMAGLKTLFVEAQISDDTPYLLRILKLPPLTSRHYSLALIMSDGKIRIFDPALKESNAETFYKELSIWWYLQDAAQALASYYISHGASHEKKGELDEASGDFKKSLYINSQNDLGHFNLGAVYYDKGDFDKATEEYEKTVEINPNSTEARINFAFAWASWYNQGIELYLQGKYDEAIKVYDKILEINPNYAKAWHNKGIALDAQGKYEEAIKSYDRALEIDPNDAAAWNNKGYAFSLLGKYKKAIKAYNKALKIDSNDAAVWHNKGLALKKQGKSKEAQKCFDKAKELGLE